MLAEEKHVEALAKIKERGGVAVSFGFEGETDYDPLTDEDTDGGPATVEGLAVEVPGDPDKYALYELSTLSTKTLVFVPNTLGELPPKDSQILWAGKKRTVKALIPVQPTGVAITASVFVV